MSGVELEDGKTRHAARDFRHGDAVTLDCIAPTNHTGLSYRRDDSS